MVKWAKCFSNGFKTILRVKFLKTSESISFKSDMKCNPVINGDMCISFQQSNLFYFTVLLKRSGEFLVWLQVSFWVDFKTKDDHHVQPLCTSFYKQVCSSVCFSKPKFVGFTFSARNFISRSWCGTFFSLELILFYFCAWGVNNIWAVSGDPQWSFFET